VKTEYEGVVTLGAGQATAVAPPAADRARPTERVEMDLSSRRPYNALSGT
jgi:hypothetical protein